MSEIGITCEADIRNFFEAFNQKRYDLLFEKYMAEDCFWYASEKPLRGKEEILNYWTTFHSSFSETLGQPEHIVFGDDCVYLQVKISLLFHEDGSFFGREYKKGEVCNFGCVDYYQLNEEKKISSGLVYVKFF